MSDHVVLTINGLIVYESHIGTRPPPEPTPIPVEPIPSPPADDPCADCTDPVFLKAISEDREMGYWDLMKRGFKGPTEQEKACMTSRGIPKPVQSKPSQPISRRGFVFGVPGAILRNQHPANVASRYVLPSSEKGAHVVFTIAENADTHTDAQVTSEVRGPAGELLSGPTTRGSSYTDHRVISPGGVLSLYVTPTLDTSLTVQWR